MTILSKTPGALLILSLILSVAAICRAQDKKPIVYGLFLDNSGSMRPHFERVKQIGKAVSKQIHERGPVSVFDFTSQGRLQNSRAVAVPEIEQIQDEQLLESTIDNLFVIGGQTTLLDAIHFVATRLNQQNGAVDKVLVLITDGEDRKSVMKPKQLIQELAELKVRVYAIGLIQELDSGPRSKAVDLLNSLTKETGGRVIFPKSNRDDLQGLLNQLGIKVD